MSTNLNSIEQLGEKSVLLRGKKSNNPYTGHGTPPGKKEGPYKQ